MKVTASVLIFWLLLGVGALAQSSRNKTIGNVCQMRIIVDKFLIKLFGNNKDLLEDKLGVFEGRLNSIYNPEGSGGIVKVRVNNTFLPLKFKVVDIKFHDEAFCQRNNHLPGRKYFIVTRPSPPILMS